MADMTTWPTSYPLPAPPVAGCRYRSPVRAEDWSARAAAVRAADREVGLRYEVRDDGPQQYAAWAESARRFREQVEGVRAPLEDLDRRLRAGDASAVRPCLDFLTADPYCFRSGYWAANLMHRLSNGPVLSGSDHVDAQEVVLMRARKPRARLMRHAARLAVAVWEDSLLARLRSLVVSGEAELAVVEDLVKRVRQQRGSDGDPQQE